MSTKPDHGSFGNNRRIPFRLQLNRKGHHVAMLEESLRMMGGGEANGYLQMQGDSWLSGALMLATAELERRYDYDEESFQKNLLQELQKKKPLANVAKQFEEAKKARRAALRDIASRLLTGKPYEEVRKQIRESASQKLKLISPSIFGIPERTSGAPAAGAELKGRSADRIPDFVDYREVTLIRLATLLPAQILPSDRFREMMDLALAAGRGIDFITTISTELKKARRGKKVLGIKKEELQMAVNWTNPEFPLWLATGPALAAILRGKFGLDEVTEDSVKKLRQRKLPGDSPYPILEFKLFKKGGHEFVLEKGLKAASSKPASSRASNP